MTSSHPISDHAWDQFKPDIFFDQQKKRLSKVGVIDVGSNSVRLVVFDGAARSPAYFYNEKIMCALGEGLAATGYLNPEGRVRAINAIKRFCHLAKAMEIPQLTAVATAAVRDAKDGKAFCAAVFETTGQKIQIINGKEEARLAAQGVLLGWPGAYGLVCDLGGSSMELAEIFDGKVGKCASSRIGPFKLMDINGGRAERDKTIAKSITKLATKMGPQHNRLFLVGGSWRVLARVDMVRRNYPLFVLHEYRMTPESVAKTLDYLSTANVEELRVKCNVSAARMALVPYAAEVLKAMLEIFQPVDIAVSSYGIREGMLFEQMPKAIRDQDPLIEACAFSESKDSRVPGFGLRLYDFVKPLFPDADLDLKRLIKAACHLHDVSWRAHPDYRAEICFDNATRANLGGLKHSERVFLGLSLMHRYRNKREGARFADLFTLLSHDQIQQAEVLGKAMRLGAMMWVDGDEKGARIYWNEKRRFLRLCLPPAAAPLYGEVAKARLSSLAQSLKAEFEFVTADKL